MGAWGTDAFDNDTAADWAWGIEECEDLEFVRSTLDEALSVGDDHLDADIASEGLAACEVIARLRGNWGMRSPFSESIDKWVEANAIEPDTEIIQTAQAVIDRVLREPSELLELWEESDATDWKAAVADLRRRVVQ